MLTWKPHRFAGNKVTALTAEQYMIVGPLEYTRTSAAFHCYTPFMESIADGLVLEEAKQACWDHFVKTQPLKALNYANGSKAKENPRRSYRARRNAGYEDLLKMAIGYARKIRVQDAEEFANDALAEWLGRFGTEQNGDPSPDRDALFSDELPDGALREQLKEIYPALRAKYRGAAESERLSSTGVVEGNIIWTAERVPEVEAAGERLKESHPRLFALWALRYGWIHPLPQKPFDMIWSRNVKVATGRRGRKGYERKGYKVSTLARLVGMRKGDLQSQIDRANQVFSRYLAAEGYLLGG